MRFKCEVCFCSCRWHWPGCPPRGPPTQEPSHRGPRWETKPWYEFSSAGESVRPPWAWEHRHLCLGSTTTTTTPIAEPGAHRLHCSSLRSGSSTKPGGRGHSRDQAGSNSVQRQREGGPKTLEHQNLRSRREACPRQASRSQPSQPLQSILSGADNWLLPQGQAAPHCPRALSCVAQAVLGGVLRSTE